MGGKFSHKLEVFLPWMLLNRNFLKENRYYPHAGWENFCAKIFPKLLLGQCSISDEISGALGGQSVLTLNFSPSVFFIYIPDGGLVPEVGKVT